MASQLEELELLDAVIKGSEHHDGHRDGVPAAVNGHEEKHLHNGVGHHSEEPLSVKEGHHHKQEEEHHHAAEVHRTQDEAENHQHQHVNGEAEVKETAANQEEVHPGHHHHGDDIDGGVSTKCKHAYHPAEPHHESQGHQHELNEQHEPHHQHQEPHHQPQEPHHQPQEPHHQPQEPHHQPQEPHHQPQEPHHQPQEPHHQPQEPHHQPQEPHHQPQEPHIEPQRPLMHYDKEKVQDEVLVKELEEVRTIGSIRRQASQQEMAKREIEEASKPVLPKASMTTSIDTGSVRAAYEDVRSDSTDTEWAVFKFQDQKIVCAATGVGFSGFRSHFEESERAFGFIRIQMGDELSKRQKFIFITWVGPKVSVIRRAKMSIDKAMVKDIIKNFAIELQVESLSEVNVDHFREQLSRVGGANYGTGVREL